jgi:hypothetical protein
MPNLSNIGQFLSNPAVIGAGIGLLAGGPAGAAVGSRIGSAIGSRRSEGRGLRGAGEQLMGYQQELGQQQAAEARQLEAQIAAMGRPQMQAEVQRLQEIADVTGMQARTGMPAAAMEAAQQNIERQQQASLAAATSLGGGMRSISGIGDTTAQQYRALNVQDVAAQQAAQQQYLGALGALAGAEGRAEAYNVLTPYEQMVASQQALEGASIQNIMGGYQTGYDMAAMKRQQNIELAGAGLQAVASVAPLIAEGVAKTSG